MVFTRYELLGKNGAASLTPQAGTACHNTHGRRFRGQHGAACHHGGEVDEENLINAEGELGAECRIRGDTNATRARIDDKRGTSCHVATTATTATTAEAEVAGADADVAIATEALGDLHIREDEEEKNDELLPIAVPVVPVKLSQNAAFAAATAVGV